jgi:SAM-dependent methyltransferase
MTDPTERILAEQHRYYEDRAPEYDDVWFRRGPYDLGPEGNARWFEETAALEQAVDDFGALGDVLELACGTGLFTRHLARTAGSLTAVDASPAVLDVNRARVADPSVEYVQSDVFEWMPPAGRRFDEIVFTFFISHVPPDRFAPFWARLATLLKPGGRIFFADDLHGADERPSNPGVQADGGPHFAHLRTLQDGREYTIVKLFYTPAGITDDLRPLGWEAEVSTTGREFIYGTAWPTPRA